MEPSSELAGNISNYNFGFRMEEDLPVDAKLAFIFPPEIDVTSVSLADSETISGSFTFLSSVDGRVEFLRSGGEVESAGYMKVQIVGGKNSSFSDVTTGSFQLEIQDGSGNFIQSGIAPGFVILSEESTEFSDVCVIPQNLSAGVKGQIIGSYRSSEEIPLGGVIDIQLDAGYDLSQVGIFDVSSRDLSGELFLNILSGNTIRISGLNRQPNGYYELMIGNVINPVISGPTSEYVISTLDENGQVIESGIAEPDVIVSDLPQPRVSSARLVNSPKNAIAAIESELPEGHSVQNIIFILEIFISGSWVFVTEDLATEDEVPVLKHSVGTFTTQTYLYRVLIRDARGNESEPSESFEAQPAVDINGNGRLDLEDVRLARDNPFDMNCDGRVDVEDKNLLLEWIITFFSHEIYKNF